MKNALPKLALNLSLLILIIGLLFAQANANLNSIVQARIVKSFDNEWLFFLGDPENAEQASFDDSSWRKLNVPHDWSIEGAIDEKNPSGKGGGFFPTGTGWYRKHFVFPNEMKNRRIFVEFDGVMANSDVWINGFHLGHRPNGFVSFSYELTEHLQIGKDNVIAVRADNSEQPASRWYTGAGIYRHVSLVMTNPVHIAQWGTFVRTPQVAENQATVLVKSQILNQSNQDQTVSLQINLLDANGKLVGAAETKSQTIAAGQTVDFAQDLTVKNPKRWDIANPHLYQAVAEVRLNGKTMDDETVLFGIREFHFDPDTGFWLNGQNFKIKGVCLHADGSAFGAAVPVAVWERRLTELKKLGVNAIRTAHNPPAPEFLDLLDKRGFLVMDEMFDQWTVAKNPFDYHLYFNEWSKIDLRDTVRRDRNHPSIIIYSAGNEIHDTPNADLAKGILRGLIDAFHENDDTRPVTQALFRPNVSRDYDNGLADMLDVVGQNYREKEILAAHQHKTSRKILGTENSHDLNQWLALRDNPPYAGQFIWAGIDYLGESPGYPSIGFGNGLLDRTGTPRGLGFQRQSWWGAAPMVYLARRVAPRRASVTDPGYEPVVAERRTQTLFSDWTPVNLNAHSENVEIYSNCDEVELFLNNKSLGKKSKPADDSPRNWSVDFEPGTIKAIGINKGQTVANYELRTAGKPHKIVLSIDKNRLINDWNDVAFATATVTDENGIVVPFADDAIEFKAAGAGVIAAVDSADNTSHEPFQATTRKAFQGKCFAMLKANKNSGKITLTATALNLRSAMITISAFKE